MSDTRDPRNRLLAETLQGDWNDGPAAAMALRAAASVRRRRRMRAVTTIAAATAAALAIIFIARRPDAPLPTEVLRAGTTAMAPAPVAKPSYEIISDDELLATLRDRPLLVLPEENGAKKIVVLEN